ncbi:hypothetical protein FIBSPDRAFT_856482, partial [Athelia psychrophila]
MYHRGSLNYIEGRNYMAQNKNQIHANAPAVELDHNFAIRELSQCRIPECPVPHLSCAM